MTQKQNISSDKNKSRVFLGRRFLKRTQQNEFDLFNTELLKASDIDDSLDKLCQYYGLSVSYIKANISFDRESIFNMVTTRTSEMLKEGLDKTQGGKKWHW